MRFNIKKPQTAFTLVELMIVVVIIGVMTAMMVSQMGGTYEDALLRSTGRELVNAFEIASSRAISLNQLHRVRLDTKSNRYIIERRAIKDRAENFVPLGISDSEGELDKRISIQIHH